MYSIYAQMASLPKTYRKLVVKKLTQKFKEATEIATTPLVLPGPGQVLVRNKFLGINASDINFAAGRYDPNAKPPFDSGFEGIGVVVKAGEGSKLKEGQAVGYKQYGAFAEYILVSETGVFPLPSTKAEYLPLMVSGLTAAIGLDKAGDLKAGDVVLVTAAAGGTGQFAVQWAKQAGAHVIGVCSSAEKVKFLESIGCDRAINYTTEDLKSVLKSEYPKGVDLVYECVGGSMFETCLDALAIKGRLIVIGFIAGYEGATGAPELSLPTQAILRRILVGSQSVRGFFLPNHAADFGEYMVRLVGMYELGKLRSEVDLGAHTGDGVTNSGQAVFKGLESIADAVEYMYAKKNIGKIVVELDDNSSRL